jgi:hypothetical protein
VERYIEVKNDGRFLSEGMDYTNWDNWDLKQID